MHLATGILAHLILRQMSLHTCRSAHISGISAKLGSSGQERKYQVLPAAKRLKNVETEISKNFSNVIGLNLKGKFLLAVIGYLLK